MWDNIVRHWSILKDAWKIETTRRKDRHGKTAEEIEFLPAALEILEKPASPIGRTVLWSIIAFMAIATAWSIFGHVDVVATAQGKLIPIDRVKVIQPADYGVIRAIHVHDGQMVQAGDVLIELDPTASGAEEEQARYAWQKAEIDRARAHALLEHMEGLEPVFVPPIGALSSTIAVQQRLIASQISEYEAQLAALFQERIEREADLKIVGREIAKLQEILPLVAEQLQARADLMEKGYSPRLVYLELKERHVGLLQDAAIQRENEGKMRASITSLDRQVDQLTEEFRKNIISDLVQADNDSAMAQQELTKASQRNVLQKLISPINGTIQQLAVHTIGGVVEPAQPLLVVVPESGGLIVDAFVANKDIGFVATGDPVEIKLEAFPFTKYGIIEGTLVDLSNDAIQDEDLGLVYQAQVEMAKDWIMVNGQKVRLGPGMSVTAEIKTGQRRVIEFLLSPLLRYKAESLRER